MDTKELVHNNQNKKSDIMKTAETIAIVLLALIVSEIPAMAQDNAKDNSEISVLTNPYFGQKPPGKKAEIFAPEVLTIEPHDSPLISQDETWLIHGTMGPNAAFYKMIDGNLSLTPNPIGIELPKVMNGGAISPSGDRIYFLEWKSTGEEFWFTEKGDNGWTALRKLDGNVKTVPAFWQFTIAMNENLYFSSDRILVSVFDGNTHLKPEPLKLEDGSDMLGISPYIAPDESYVIYSLNWNLHISYNLGNDKWTAPLDLGPDINSEQADHCPKISPNGKYLFFNSRRISSDWVVFWADAGFIEDLKPPELR